MCLYFLCHSVFVLRPAGCYIELIFFAYLKKLFKNILNIINTLLGNILIPQDAGIYQVCSLK